MNRPKKGDIVLVNASVYTKGTEQSQMPPGSGWSLPKEIVRPEYEGKGWQKHPRGMRRITYKTPFFGLAIGYSTRQTGWFIWGSYDEPGHLTETTHHPVIMVQPLFTDRFLKPFASLPEDLEIIQSLPEWLMKIMKGRKDASIS
jgi:hypothetical protein